MELIFKGVIECYKFQILFFKLAVEITVHQNLGPKKWKFDTRCLSLSLKASLIIILSYRDRLYDSSLYYNFNAAVVYKPENKHS